MSAVATNSLADQVGLKVRYFQGRIRITAEMQSPYLYWINVFLQGVNTKTLGIFPSI